jgi:type IX secretion system substrate protein/centrosomal CEP192-like protein/beta-propeller repeat-containing protein
LYNFGKTILKYLLLIVFIPVTIYSQISVSPSFINFGELGINSQNDTTITITSEIDDVLQSFDFKFGSPFYSIVEQLPISLKKDEPKSLTIRYIPNDSVKSYTEYELKTNEQSIEIGFLGGYKYQDTIIEATTITSPTKGDYYLYQDEIVINWTKVPGFDRYIIQFLANNGAGWSTITDSAIGTSYIWKAPHLNSDKCIFRVEPYIEPKKKILEVEWDKYIGISRTDISNKLIQTRDGGYIIVGSTLGQDSSSDHKLYSDILIIKTNSIGEQIWTRTYGGKEGDDFAYSVVEDNDNNLFVVGKTNSTDFGLSLNGGFDLLFMKLNPSGDIILKKNFGKEQEDAAVDIELSNDGNLFLGGFSNLEEIQERYSVGQYDYWLLKLNKSGEQIWSKYYGFDKNELITDIQLSINGGVILFGRSNSRDSVYMGDKYGTFKDKDHGWIVKVDNEGEMEWDFQYVHGRDEPYIITESAKGEIYVSGYTVFYHNSNNIKRNLWLLKLNELGEEVWIKRFSNQSDDVPVGIKINDNDEIFLFTFYFTNDGLFKRVYKLLSSNYTAYYKNFYYLNGSGSRGFCSTFDNGMAFIGTRTDIKKETPFNFNLVKISNEQLYDIGYSDLFEIASSKPHFTVDTISFPKVCEGELVDTVIIDMVCNDGVIPVEIQDFFFWLAEDEFKIDSVYGDNILEPGECMDMGFSFLSKDGHGKEYILYANYSFGRSADRVLLKGNVYLSKLSFSNSAFSFFNVIEKQKSDVKYLVIKNNSRSSIEVKIKKKNNNNFTINEGVDSFTIDAQKEIDIPIVFNPNSVDVFKMDFNLEFDGNKISDTIHLFGTSIKDINTNVTNYNMSSSSLDISPNPASEQLNIDITTGVQGTMKLELVATDGRVIYTDEWTQSTKSKQMQINTMNIPSGLYQVRLITPYDAITKSVIVVE